MAKDIGNFQIPGGTFKVYNKTNTKITYIGAASFGITKGEDKIKLETGKTQDILCTFTIKGYKINKNIGEAELYAVFENRKNKTVSIEWIEKFSDGSWEITNSNSEYEQLDAYSVLFVVDIPANSTKEISFKAKIEKD